MLLGIKVFVDISVASRKKGFSKTQQEKWIKEGRGSGEYAEYKPWLTVRDLPSLGRAQRIYGQKSKRTHQLLSDLELAAFLLLEWHTEVTQIREQFPLEIHTTRRLSADAGTRHAQLGGVEQYMSSDFLVDSVNTQVPRFIWQAKYASALNDPRTIEKLEIERRYWTEKNYPFYLVTEREIPTVVFKNIQWLYPAQRDDEEDEELTQQKIEFYAQHFERNQNKTIIAICKELDAAYDLPLGESLFEIRKLLAKRYFVFDVFIPTIKLKASDLKVGDIGFIREVYLVSNQ